MFRRGLILLAALVLLGFASFAQAENESDTSKNETVTAAIGEDGVQRAEIVGDSYFFKPNHVIVKVNVPVELKLSKVGWFVPHDFVIDAPEAGISVKVDLDTDPKTVRLTPTKAGKYPFYCDKEFLFFESHREKGMEGVLEVVE